MKRRWPVIVASSMLAVTTLFVMPARAATITVIANNSGVGPCNTAFSGVFLAGGAQCFFVDGKITASITGTIVDAINPITAYVGDTISISNQGSSHNMIFCKTGTTVNGWNCGDPIDPAGTDPNCCQSSSGAGAPSKIGFSSPGDPAVPSATTLDTAGTFYFWCGLGNHRLSGQYGKLVVLSGERPTTTTTTSTTSTTSPATTTPPTTIASQTTTASVVAAPTLSVKKAGGRVTASGKTTAGARVSLQKLVGKKWVTVASAKASSSGSYTIRAKAESKRTTYRVLVGSRTSTTRPV